jgi:hypothetical protein
LYGVPVIEGGTEAPMTAGRYTYWLLLSVRDAIPSPQPLVTAEFTTLRLRLIKIGACITEIATRVRIAFTAACPEADLFAGLVRGWGSTLEPSKFLIPSLLSATGTEHGTL